MHIEHALENVSITVLLRTIYLLVYRDTSYLLYCWQQVCLLPNGSLLFSDDLHQFTALLVKFLHESCFEWYCTYSQELCIQLGNI